MYAASFIFGYLVWLIDEFVCQSLIVARHAVGLPVAFLLELHGWYVDLSPWSGINLNLANKSYKVACLHCHWWIYRRGGH